MRPYTLCVLIIMSGILISCEKFDDNRRIFIKGQLTNTEILNQNSVEVYATFDHILDFGFDDENILSQTSINQDGRFDMIIPAPVNDVVYIQVNPNRETEGQTINEFSSLSFIISRSRVDSQELIDIEEFELSESAFLNLNFSHVSTSASSLNWQINYVENECVTDFENLQESSISEFCNNTSTQAGVLQDDNQTLTFRSQLGTEAILSYSINEGEIQTFTIPLNSIENNFEIEY